MGKCDNLKENEIFFLAFFAVSTLRYLQEKWFTQSAQREKRKGTQRLIDQNSDK